VVNVTPARAVPGEGVCAVFGALTAGLTTTTIAVVPNGIVVGSFASGDVVDDPHAATQASRKSLMPPAISRTKPTARAFASADFRSHDQDT
jgi:hypothetical protein